VDSRLRVPIDSLWSFFEERIIGEARSDYFSSQKAAETMFAGTQTIEKRAM